MTAYINPHQNCCFLFRFSTLLSGSMLFLILVVCSISTESFCFIRSYCLSVKLSWSGFSIGKMNRWCSCFKSEIFEHFVFNQWMKIITSTNRIWWRKYQRTTLHKDEKYGLLRCELLLIRLIFLINDSFYRDYVEW